MGQAKSVLFKRFDVVIYAFVLLCAVLLLIIGTKKETTASLSVNISGTEAVYSLNEERTFELNNNGISVKVEVKNGSVWVYESSCPDKVCMSIGKIAKVGQIIVCAPAEISLKIIGNGEGEYDAITR